MSVAFLLGQLMSKACASCICLAEYALGATLEQVRLFCNRFVSSGLEIGTALPIQEWRSFFKWVFSID